MIGRRPRDETLFWQKFTFDIGSRFDPRQPKNIYDETIDCGWSP